MGVFVLSVKNHQSWWKSDVTKHLTKVKSCLDILIAKILHVISLPNSIIYLLYLWLIYSHLLIFGLCICWHVLENSEVLWFIPCCSCIKLNLHVIRCWCLENTHVSCKQPMGHLNIKTINVNFLFLREEERYFLFISHLSQASSLESSPTSPFFFLAHGLPLPPDPVTSVIITNNTQETLLEHKLEPTGHCSMLPLSSNTLW